MSKSTAAIEARQDADAKAGNASIALQVFARDYLMQVDHLATAAEIRQAFKEMKGRVF